MNMLDEQVTPLCGRTITTIIPTYRRPKLLQRAIRSVLNQTYPDFQLCVYDNASGDETRETVERFGDRRIRYFCREYNLGMVENFRRSVEGVSTAFFHLLSDDDLIFPRFFELAMNELARAPEAVCFVGATVRAYDDGKVIEVPLEGWPQGLCQPPLVLEDWFKKGSVEWTSIVFRREVLSRQGFIDPEAGLSADGDYLLRIFARYPIVVSREPCAVFVAHPDSATTRGGLDRFWPAFGKIIATLEDLPFPDETERRKAIAMGLAQARMTIFSCGLKAAVKGQPDEAHRAARILRDRFQRGNSARLVRLATMNNLLGRMAREAVRLTYDVRAHYRTARSAHRWKNRYGQVVQRLFQTCQLD